MLVVKIHGEKLSLMQIVILAMLKSGPKSSIDIVSEVMEKLGYKYKPSIYTALRELRRRGFVAAIFDERRGVNIYYLTEKGLRILSEIPQTLSSLCSEITRHISYLSELLGITPIILRVSREIYDPEALAEYRKLLVRLLKEVDEKLKRWRKIKIE